MASETSKDSPLAIEVPPQAEEPPNLVTPAADAPTFFPKERPSIDQPKDVTPQVAVVTPDDEPKEPAPVVAVVTPDEAPTPEVPSAKLAPQVTSAKLAAAPPIPQVAKLAAAAPMPLPGDQPEAKLAPAPSLRKRSRALLNGDAASSLDERVPAWKSN